MTLKFSTGLPNCREGRLCPIGSVTIEGMLRIARLADELGYASLWPNEIFSARDDVSTRFAALPSLFDCLVTMSYAAAATRSIRLCSSTIVLPLHDPVVLSRQVATLDVFSGGRVTLGVGLGGKPEEYRSMHGHAGPVHRGDLMDEQLQALRLLWEAPSATFKGRYVSIEGLESHTRPLQRPLPVFAAGTSEAAVRRVARYAQGWIVSKILPHQVAARLDQLRSFAEEADRGDQHFEVARQFYVSIGETEAEAWANYRAVIPDATGKPLGAVKSEERQLVGTPDQIAERVRAYADVGVTELAMIFYYPDPEAGEHQLRLFAREVMPAFA
jgi:probable F420-dependent oxidoreductase